MEKTRSPRKRTNDKQRKWGKSRCQEGLTNKIRKEDVLLGGRKEERKEGGRESAEDIRESRRVG